MMALMLMKRIWIPDPLYKALPVLACLVGSLGFMAAGPSMLMVLVSWSVIAYGLLIMLVRMCLEGLSNGR